MSGESSGSDFENRVQRSTLAVRPEYWFCSPPEYWFGSPKGSIDPQRSSGEPLGASPKRSQTLRR